MCVCVRMHGAITYVRSLMHDALTATRPTIPRTVIGAGESESVPVATDSVVHKRGGRCLFPSRTRHSPSLPIRSSLSRSSSPSLSRPYRQPIAVGKQKPSCTLSTYSVRCAGVLSGARVYKSGWLVRDTTPHTRPRSTVSLWETLLRPSSTSFSCRTSRAPPLEPLFLPYARKTRPPDTTLCH